MRSSARRMLQAALEREADDYVKAHAHLRNEHGHRVVKRNGHQPEREILTGAGPLAIQRPHVRDPRTGHTFTSAILPRYMRRSPSLADRRSADALIPALYLRGVSTNDFALALEAILGPQAGNLSPSSISRLKGPGWRNTGNGTSGTPRANGMSTSGLTGCTSMSAWETSARV